jgi:methyltransferase (TIGR00027 family)
MRDESNAIDSATRVAFLRALGHQETDSEARCSDHLAHHFLNDEWKMALRFRSSMLARFEATAPGMYCYALARTRFFDDLLEQAIGNGIQQIIIIGSGYDSRAYRFFADHPLTFVEVDTPNIHRAKTERIRAAQLDIAGNCVLRIGLDLRAQDLVAGLAKADIDWSAPLLVLAEGVLYYLPDHVFSSLLDGLFAGRAARGSMLAFDYMNTEVLRRPDDFHGGEAVKMLEGKSETVFQFTATSSDIRRRCAQAGLADIHDRDESDIARLYLTRLDGTTLGRPLGGFHLCCARVA